MEKVTIETVVNAKLDKVWDVWNNPEDIKQWNSPHESWHTTRSEVDLREGGKFLSRMEAKDGSAGFDFEGVFTRVEPQKAIGYRMGDGREVEVEFTGVAVDPFGATRAGFTGETEISRKEFGLTWNAALEAGGVLVSDKVKINLDAALVKQA